MSKVPFEMWSWFMIRRYPALVGFSSMMIFTIESRAQSEETAPFRTSSDLWVRCLLSNLRVLRDADSSHSTFLVLIARTGFTLISSLYLDRNPWSFCNLFTLYPRIRGLLHCPMRTYGCVSSRHPSCHVTGCLEVVGQPWSTTFSLASFTY